MLLEIYDKYTFERIDVIRTFTFVQYTDYFNKVGTFTVTVPVNEVSVKNLMVSGNYILFEPDVIGIIKFQSKQSIETPTITIKGYLIEHLLSYRVFERTRKYSGQLFEVQRRMVDEHFISNNDRRRLMPFISMEEEYPESEKVTVQNTGDTVIDFIMECNKEKTYGFDLVPKIISYNESGDKPTNIETFIFKVKKPTYRTVGNKSGLNPVVFSVEMNNLSELEFEDDETEFCSMAYVAGEDTGEDRKVIETGDIEAEGIDRIELYVDARDIQSEEGGGGGGEVSYMTYSETYDFLLSDSEEDPGDGKDAGYNPTIDYLNSDSEEDF